MKFYNHFLKSKNIFDFLIAFFIFDLLFLILAFTPQGVKAQRASFYLSPAEGNYEVGENFSVNVYISAEGIAINAAQAKILFPPEKLKVKDISKSGSIFTLWVQEPVFSNSKGEISFGGGLPSPGYIGKKGKVFSILFEAKTEGEAKVNFGEEIITANDPTGKNIFSFSQGAVFTIITGLVPEELPKKPKPAEIDTKPPEPFEITVDNEGDPANPQPLLYFQAKDDLSGISHYEIKIGVGDTFKVFEVETNPFRLPHQAPGVHKIIVKAIDRAGNYTESTTEVKVESIPVPEITVCPGTYMSGEEILYIEGNALPEHETLIFLKTDEKLIKDWEVMNSEKGDWFLKDAGLFKSGIYKISARAKNAKGAISNPSKECTLRIILSGIQIGPLLISYKNLLWIFILILIFILFVILYLLLKVKRSKRRIKRETQDLKEKFDKEYKELESDIKRELEELKRIRGKRKITEKEKKREEELLKNLADIKTVFEKELKDVEK